MNTGSKTFKAKLSVSLEDFIITVYVLVDDYVEVLTKDSPLRRRGPLPSLSDAEVITIEIVGEYLGLGNDKKTWLYFKEHWHPWFPGLGSRTSFTRQCANLMLFKNRIQESLSQDLTLDQDLFLCDGFPIPLIHIKRYKRSKNLLKAQGSVGYCASKDMHYFGFKGHLLVTQHGLTKAFEMAPANVDERDMIPELTHCVKGTILADKGLIRPSLKEELRQKNVNLQTPLRSNMKDNRPPSFVQKIMNIRRKIETVIGQLTQRFHIQSIKAKDLWHLSAKVGRKILAHTFSFKINSILNPDNPLAIENILS